MAVVHGELHVTVAVTGDPPDGVRVIVDVLIVVASIVSLNVTITFEFVATFVAPGAGTRETIVGGVLSVTAAVVKADATAAASGFPARSFTPVDTVNV